MALPKEGYSPEDIRTSEIAQAFYEEYLRPTDDDEIISAFSKAAYDLYTDPAYPILHDTINDALTMRPSAHSLSPNDVVNISLRLFQMFCLQRDPDNYADASYEQPEKWRSIIKESLADSALREQADAILVWRVIQSNIATRSLAIQLVLASEQERYGIHPSLMEVGASDGQISKALHHKHGLWRNLEIVVPVLSQDSTDTRVKAAPEATAFARKIVQTAYAPGTTIDIDIFNPNDPGNMAWIFACSFRPKEYREGRNRRLFQKLQAITMLPVSRYPTSRQSLYFYQGEFSEDGMRNFGHETNIEKVDVVMFPTVLYMQPQRAKAMLDLSTRYVATNGSTLVLDRARPNPENPSELEILDSWGFNHYGLMIRHADDPEGTFHEIFRMVSDRSDKIMLGKDIGKIAIGGQLQELTGRLT